jgi:hypothetical protein
MRSPSDYRAPVPSRNRSGYINVGSPNLSIGTALRVIRRVTGGISRCEDIHHWVLKPYVAGPQRPPRVSRRLPPNRFIDHLRFR